MIGLGAPLSKIIAPDENIDKSTVRSTFNKDIQTKTTTETPVYTEQQIGKATLNTPIIKKDNAQNREKQDEQKLHKMQESFVGLEQ